MPKMPRPVPSFPSEAEQRNFQESHDSKDPVDRSSAKGARSRNAATTAISLRLPISLLERIKLAAQKRDMPYQALINAWLAEKLEQA